jgi:hypothetical protein
MSYKQQQCQYLGDYGIIGLMGLLDERPKDKRLRTMG